VSSIVEVGQTLDEFACNKNELLILKVYFTYKFINADTSGKTISDDEPILHTQIILKNHINGNLSVDRIRKIINAYDEIKNEMVARNAELEHENQIKEFSDYLHNIVDSIYTEGLTSMSYHHRIYKIFIKKQFKIS